MQRLIMRKMVRSVTENLSAASSAVKPSDSTVLHTFMSFAVRRSRWYQTGSSYLHRDRGQTRQDDVTSQPVSS